MHVMEMTPRQWDVLVELVKDGPNNGQIARRLYMSEDTVKCHMKALLQAGGYSCRTSLAVAVLRWDVALATRVPPRHLRK